jgi:hypothetical protein
MQPIKPSWNSMPHGLISGVINDGSYSAAVPKEKISWGKLTKHSPMFVIEAEATMVAPGLRLRRSGRLGPPAFQFQHGRRARRNRVGRTADAVSDLRRRSPLGCYRTGIPGVAPARGSQFRHPLVLPNTLM